MKEEELYSILNKGVPNYVPIDMDLEFILNNCASDKLVLRNEYLKIVKDYQKFFYENFGACKNGANFFRLFRTVTDVKDASNSLSISPVSFINEYKRILGIDNPATDIRKLRNEIKTKLSELDRVTSVNELKEKFPDIYKDYQLSIIMNNNNIKDEREYQETKDVKKKKEIKKRVTYMVIHALDADFNGFMNVQRQMYRNFSLNYYLITNYSVKNKIDLSGFEGLDKDKFGLYVAYLYLLKAELSNNINAVQNCIYYLLPYLRETRNNDVSIVINGKNISRQTIKDRYKRLNKKYPNLNPIDEDRQNFKEYHIQHVRNHINKYYSNSVNWVLADGEVDETRRDVLKSTMERQYRKLSKEERDLKVQSALDMYDRKIKFYESSGYATKIFGVKKFDGYIAYIYSNGEVLLDKLFSDHIDLIPSNNDAIFRFNVEYFEEVSRLRKNEFKDNEHIERKLHTDNWEDRMKVILSRKSTKDYSDIIRDLEIKYKLKR